MSSLYSMTEEDLQNFANSIKDRIAEQLNLPELDEYFVVLGKKNIFRSILAKLTLLGSKPPETNEVVVFLMKPAVLIKKDSKNV